MKIETLKTLNQLVKVKQDQSAVSANASNEVLLMKLLRRNFM